MMTVLVKLPDVKFHENTSNGWTVVSDGCMACRHAEADEHISAASLLICLNKVKQ